MPNSGVSGTTAATLALGPAIVYRGSVVIGTLAASAEAEEVTEWRRLRIAGLGVPLEGTDRAVSRTLRITGEFLEHSAAETTKWTAGVNASGVVTPPDVGVFFTAGQYDDAISFRFFLGNGDQFKATMASGLVTGYPFAGQDPGEGASTVTWEARGAVGGPDDAPYEYEFVPVGGNPDPHLALVDDLGGNAAVAAIYVATDGLTGLQADSLVVNAGVVDEWQDYRHPTSYAPKITFAGTAKPAWDGGAKTVVSDGVDDVGATIASALFDTDGVRGMVVVASHTSGTYVATLSDGAAARMMGFYKDPTNWSLQTTTYPGANSGVAADSTRRVVIGAKDATTTAKVTVPNQSQGTVTGGLDEGAGNNVLTLFRASVGAGPSPAAVVLKAVLVLNFDPDATQRGIIRDWAIAELGAVAA